MAPKAKIATLNKQEVLVEPPGQSPASPVLSEEVTVIESPQGPAGRPEIPEEAKEAGRAQLGITAPAKGTKERKSRIEDGFTIYY